MEGIKPAQILPTLVPIDLIIEAVCARTGVRLDQILSRKRDLKTGYARHLSMYLVTVLNRGSLADLSRYFERDHSTVISGIRRIELETLTNIQTSEDILYVGRKFLTSSEFIVALRWFRDHRSYSYYK